MAEIARLRAECQSLRSQLALRGTELRLDDAGNGTAEAAATPTPRGGARGPGSVARVTWVEDPFVERLAFMNRFHGAVVAYGTHQDSQSPGDPTRGGANTADEGLTLRRGEYLLAVSGVVGSPGDNCLA